MAIINFEDIETQKLYPSTIFDGGVKQHTQMKYYSYLYNGVSITIIREMVVHAAFYFYI